VTRRRSSVAAVAVVWYCLSGSTLAAQVTGTVEVGTSWVDYEGFLGSGAAFVTPTLRYEGPDVSLGVSGSYVVFESGSRILQGLMAGGWRTRLGDRFLGELSGSAGINSYEDYPGYGHLLSRARLHFAGPRSGAWLGAATGQSYAGSASATPYEIQLGGWTVSSGLAMGATATHTWIAETDYFDVLGTARIRDRFFEIEGSLGFRAWGEGGGEGVYGELHIQVPLVKRLTALVAGGRYPSDPVRGVITANYVSAGLRIHALTASSTRAATLLGNSFGTSVRSEPPRTGQARLTIGSSAHSYHTIRVEAPGAEYVELSGDFTDWRPVPLVRTERGNWELAIHIEPGVHRVNVRLNTATWIVPQGVRAEEDEFGGRVGILVVPER